ncbi:MAG: SDR family oxidoreductase [Anaerolineales bacterium]|nr:SDR family oxidoreductase [Anaerolineales bacterium]
MTLQNRVVVITGATGGLGSQLTRELAIRGAQLALLGRDAARLEALTASLSVPKERILSCVVDLLDPSETRRAAQDIAARFGRIEILLHLVGGWTGGKTLVEASADDLTFMLNQHVWTSFHVVQAFIPYLVKNGWGRVVMVSSPYAARPRAKSGPYAIAKAGQEALLLTLSQELQGTGVTANLVQVKTIDLQREKVNLPTPQNAFWSTPEELSAAILYLLSEEAGSVNGARLPLYGSY